MKGFTVAMFLISMLQNCQSECLTQNTAAFHLTDNSALLHHAYKQKTASSPVICGRDCSIEPRCASFNYNTDYHVCELSNTTRALSPADFVERQGSAYYDHELHTDDNFNTPVYIDTPAFTTPAT